MPRSAKQKQGFGYLFEEDYLVRTLGRIARDPEVALTELVANAWDAGASQVDTAIPLAKDANLVVRDNGHGLTPAQFKARWMTLGYDRVKNQGEDVEFAPERKDLRRRAYGRNGAGRHGLLCFGDLYSVETWRGGRAARSRSERRAGKNHSVSRVKRLSSGRAVAPSCPSQWLGTSRTPMLSDRSFRRGFCTTRSLSCGSTDSRCRWLCDVVGRCGLNAHPRYAHLLLPHLRASYQFLMSSFSRVGSRQQLVNV
ncbi:histidine kinase/DNA gyrase B/HSP90-like ATPase [Paraburkholderia sp. BL23I1N1]|uniref:ATP-binding protein n=1 Tax=unclassified Paraburkholderia TaxID=2615204 RepID=UPI000E3699C6|nr:histidine kinase/DNA gyrase B/HSP90-like ATPase [Paraburkholderia sp. BL27I4N3]RKE35659.1 histidine kinase/DNA gyrase B/HSP90-like ATPase [Paraburkholderia sp. BL23I1N1]